MDPRYYRDNGGSFFFMRNFRPSATPYIDFSNPGACNVKLHSVYVPMAHCTTQNKICKKTEIVQTGGGDIDPEIFKKPIKVKRTILAQFEAGEETEETSKQTKGKEGEQHSSKQGKRSKDLPPKSAKKKKYTFNIKA
jgi:hypothetical protein